MSITKTSLWNFWEVKRISQDSSRERQEFRQVSYYKISRFLARQKSLRGNHARSSVAGRTGLL